MRLQALLPQDRLLHHAVVLGLRLQIYADRQSYIPVQSTWQTDTQACSAASANTEVPLCWRCQKRLILMLPDALQCLSRPAKHSMALVGISSLGELLLLSFSYGGAVPNGVNTPQVPHKELAAPALCGAVAAMPADRDICWPWLQARHAEMMLPAARVLRSAAALTLACLKSQWHDSCLICGASAAEASAIMQDCLAACCLCLRMQAGGL